MKRFLNWSALVLLVTTSVYAWAGETKRITTSEPENLALRAQVSASSEQDGEHVAKFAVDGLIPQENASRRDNYQAWAVNGKKARDKGHFTLTWPNPVSVAELVYFGRTSIKIQDCWKEYEVYLDGAEAPAVKGSFLMRSGPQRVTLPPTRVRSITIKLLSSHGGPHPGASEIMLFERPISEKHFAELNGEDTSLPPANLKLGKILLIQRHAINPTHVYTYHVEGYRPGGGLYVFTPDGVGGTLEPLVESPNGQILDCALSYDGTELLFSWKRGGREYNDQFDRSLPPDTNPDHMYVIYRMNIDGTDLTALTDGNSNNMNPCWLSDGDIAFLSDRKSAFAYCFVSTSPVLYRMNRDGGDVRRLSANYLNDFTPNVLQDGRIIYSRWEYVDRPAVPIQGLWSLHPDGTNLSHVFGNRVLSPATFMEARSIPGTNQILCVLTSHNGPCRGAIGIIDRSDDANGQEAIRNLTPEVEIGLVDEGNGNDVRGPYENPFPIDDEYFLVSRQGTIILRDYDGTEQSVLLRPKGEMGFYSPKPIASRARPPLIPTTRAIIDGAEQWIIDGTEQWATLHLQDVYNGLEPHVKRGEVTRIAVIQEIEKSRWAPQDFSAPRKGSIAAFGYQFPLVSCGATYAPKRVWGFADVEADGSASFRVPAGKPIYFMALDAEGRAVQRMRSFTHLMPGEEQACIGCHTNRNYAARPNGIRPLSTQQPPQKLQPPEWGIGGFSYPHIVQPVLDQHCVKCHNAQEMPGGVDLSGHKTDFFNVSYDILARKGTLGERDYARRSTTRSEMGENPYTSWIPTYNGEEANILKVTPKTWGSPVSKLAKLIATGHPDKHGKPRVDMEPEARQRLYTWIDLNVPYYHTSESSHYNRKGCRQFLPDNLDKVLSKIAKTRCASCHSDGVPRTFYTRILEPEFNNFLLAPLAKSAGGTQVCGEAVFKDTDDTDYQAILKTFSSVQQLLQERPRMDMVDNYLDSPQTCSPKKMALSRADRLP